MTGRRDPRVLDARDENAERSERPGRAASIAAVSTTAMADRSSQVTDFRNGVIAARPRRPATIPALGA